MFSRDQIKNSSKKVLESEYRRAKDLRFDLVKSFSWNEYLNALRKELAIRKGKKK